MTILGKILRGIVAVGGSALGVITAQPQLVAGSIAIGATLFGDDGSGVSSQYQQVSAQTAQLNAAYNSGMTAYNRTSAAAQSSPAAVLQSLPAWLLPVGVIGFLFLLFRRRSR